MQLIDVTGSRIFPKFWSIPFLISPSTPKITDTVLCPHFPHSRGFNLKVFVFRELFNDFLEVFRSDGTNTYISLQHRLAWSLITISGLFADSSLSVCISQRIVTSSFSVTVSSLCSYHLSIIIIIMEVFIEHISPLTKYGCERIDRPRQLY